MLKRNEKRIKKIIASEILKILYISNLIYSVLHSLLS